MNADFNHKHQGITLFLAGDVMTGRGIDQVLPDSVDPRLYESYVKDAREYVRLAERLNGNIIKPVNYTYIWGDALQIWAQLQPDLKIINLETSITEALSPWPDKEVQYKMHPNNVAVLKAAGIDFCSLANNHTLDWGRTGLLETMQTLQAAHIPFGGAGESINEGRAPAILPARNSRVIVLCYGSVTSGIPLEWAATEKQSGINLITRLTEDTVQSIARQVEELKQPGDVVVFSIHWGSNWGYDIYPYQQNFAHQLIDEAGVDLVFGHSSHHPLGLEVYKGKLIIYGAGDFINDYEGIRGHEQFRSDLSLMYYPQLDSASGKLISLQMVPMQIKNFKLNFATPQDVDWLATVLNRECKVLGTSIEQANGYLMLRFNQT